MGEENPRWQRRTRKYEETAEQPKAPFLVRLAAQVSLALICLSAGYYSCEYAVGMLNRKEIVNQKNVVASSEDLQRLLMAESKQQIVVTAKKELKIYPLGVQDNLFKSLLKVFPDVQENEIREALKKLFSETAEPWTASMEPLHVFRDGIYAYIDLPRGFSARLSAMPEKRALLLLTGIVKTLVENFPPISQVYFLEEGRWIPGTETLRLSDPWGFSTAKI